MSILTLELFEVTVSEALREINRALDGQPALPLRILLGSDPMLQHNIQRFLQRQGRAAALHQDPSGWRIEVPGLPQAAAPAPAVPAAITPAPVRVLPARGLAAPRPGSRPLLITSAHLGQGSKAIGRRMLLGVLRELDPSVPWVGLALDGLELLDDPEARTVLAQLQARGTKVRISRESQLFPLEPDNGFEIMEDSGWQRLAGRGELTLL